MTIREQTEAREKSILSPRARLAAESAGRSVPEQKCPLRTDFQRDRDRIIHSKSFRRLKNKTQVFFKPEGDHYTTRMTHTLEVAQIARTIARALSLNEDLTEAIALGHDLGHTPFGHEGERVLARLCPFGFAHNEHSLRVVDVLEASDGQPYGGLNLTAEVRDGILCHTGEKRPDTAEGEVVRLADKIAYISRDVEDAVRGRVIGGIPEEFRSVLGGTHSRRVNTMSLSCVENSLDSGKIRMGREVFGAMKGLLDFMTKNVYTDSAPKREEEKVRLMLESIYTFLAEYPERLEKSRFEISQSGDVHRVVCDYVAGMTDRFAVSVFEEIFVPKPWEG